MKEKFIKLMAFLLSLSLLPIGIPASAYEEKYLSEDAGCIAYMDISDAPQELQKQIISERNAIISEHEWVADGFSSSVIDVATGDVIRELPEFHEIFPKDWDLPIENDISDVAFEDSYMPFSSDYTTIFNGNVYLNKPSTSSISSPFGYFNLDKNHMLAYTYASSLTASETCNIGYSNRATGEVLNTATRLKQGQAVTVGQKDFFNPKTITINVRASTFSSPGWSTMVVNRSNDSTSILSD